jgi:hypothetical protein
LNREEGRRRVERFFTKELIVRQTLDLYETALTAVLSQSARNHGVAETLAIAAETPVLTDPNITKAAAVRGFGHFRILERAKGFEPSTPTLASGNLQSKSATEEFTRIRWRARESAVISTLKRGRLIATLRNATEFRELQRRQDTVTAR